MINNYCHMVAQLVLRRIPKDRTTTHRCGLALENSNNGLRRHHQSHSHLRSSNSVKIISLSNVIPQCVKIIINVLLKPSNDPQNAINYPRMKWSKYVLKATTNLLSQLPRILFWRSRYRHVKKLGLELLKRGVANPVDRNCNIWVVRMISTI
jgi:hypothetical protein